MSNLSVVAEVVERENDTAFAAADASEDRFGGNRAVRHDGEHVAFDPDREGLPVPVGDSVSRANSPVDLLAKMLALSRRHGRTPVITENQEARRSATS